MYVFNITSPLSLKSWDLANSHFEKWDFQCFVNFCSQNLILLMKWWLLDLESFVDAWSWLWMFWGFGWFVLYFLLSDLCCSLFKNLILFVKSFVSNLWSGKWGALMLVFSCEIKFLEGIIQFLLEFLFEIDWNWIEIDWLVVFLYTTPLLLCCINLNNYPQLVLILLERRLMNDLQVTNFLVFMLLEMSFAYIEIDALLQEWSFLLDSLVAA